MKTIYINKNLNQNNPSQEYISNLTIYSPIDSIQYKYSIIANIEIRNNAISGNLIFDERMKKYLLYSINEIGADALIYNEDKSNQDFSYFKAIKYFPSDSINIILYD